MKGKFLIVLLAIICAVCCAAMFSACGDKNQSEQTGDTNSENSSPHVHSYGNWDVIIHASHATEGMRRKYCSCGEYIEETIPKTTEHNFQLYSHKDATCTEAGEDVLRCECGAEKRDTIPPTHTYDHCECTVCGAIKPGAIAVKVYVDNELYDTIYTNIDYYYQIELPQMPRDWRDDKSILSYFDGWYTDKDCTALATGQEVYLAPSAIYGQQLTNDACNYECTFSDNEATITKIKSMSGRTIFIPRYINNFPVTGIADNAFNETQISYLFLSDNLRTIGASAFRSCSYLLKVFFSEGLTSIGSGAFTSCGSLKGVYITNLKTWCNIEFGSYFSNPLYYANNLYLNNNPVTEITADMLQGVTEIKDYAFMGYNSLESIEIPAGVTSIGSNAFRGCRSLGRITVDPNNKNYASQYGVLYNKAKTQLISAPSGIKGNLAIPDGVTSIGSNDFSDCASLESISIPASVTSIGMGAFNSCSSLVSVNFGDKSKLTSIGDSAFRGCRILESIEIPAGVTSIGDSAFNGCTLLTSITIPNSVTSIGSGAFDSCTSLATVYYGGNITQWNDISFSDYYGIYATRYYFSETAPDETKWAESENWWHYDPVTGEIAIWKKD